MSKVTAVLDQIEAEHRQGNDELIPDNIPLQELAEQVVRGKRKLSPPQLRMLIELLPFYMAKLSAVSVGYMTNSTFADKLERAINRSNRARLIEGQVVQVDEDSSKEELSMRLRRGNAPK